MPPVYETLLLNTVVPQIQAAQAGDSYVMVVNATTPALRITQTGTGDAILVEDAANPDSSPFVVNASGNIGMGVSSPNAKVDVVVSGATTTLDGLNLGNGTASAIFQLSGATYSYRGVGANNLWIGTNSGHDMYIGPSTANVLKFGSAAFEYMRLDSSGNLGIGTTLPTAKLEVTGNILQTWAASHNRFIGTQFSTTYENGLRFLEASRETRIISKAADSNDKITFYTGVTPTERMTLGTSGNLGLGVTPNAGWLGAGYMDYPSNGFIGNASAYSGNSLNVGLNAYYGSGAWRYKASSLGARRIEFADSEFRFWTAPSGTAGDPISFTQAMTLDASGNLALGNTSVIAGARADIRGANSNNLSDLDAQVLTVFDTTSYAQNVGGGIAFGYKFNSSNSYIQRAAVIKAVKENSTDGNYASALAFATTANGASTTERARITSGGEFLVGATSTLTNSDSGFKVLTPAADHWDPAVVTPVNNSSYSCWDIYSTGAGAYQFYVTTTGVINATNTTISAISDVRLKENIQDLDVGLDKIMALKPRKFDWKEGNGKNIKGDRGWIAQEFEQVFPDMIDEWKDPAPEGEEPYKSVRADLIPVLVKAIQEQQAMINELKAEVAALKGA